MHGRPWSGRGARALGGLVAAIALLTSLLLPLDGAYQSGLARAGDEAVRPVVLDVALVNEDLGAATPDGDVNLGRAYVKQVESDTSARWRVVSRGVGERGLALGSYHLLVVIPTTFSEKVVDLRAEDPEPIGVTYQVNGRGSARVEALAQTRGREIVSQLNARLVDVYVASILVNLRQAQSDVRVMVDAGAGNADVYVAAVAPSARALGAALGVLDGSAEGSAGTQRDLVDALDGLDADTAEAAADGAEHDASLADLVAAREAGALSHAAFLEALLATDARLVGDEVQALYDQLDALRESFENQLDSGPGTDNHADAVGWVSDLTARSADSVADRTATLASTTPAQLVELYAAAVHEALDVDVDAMTSLADIAAAALPDGLPATEFAQALEEEVHAAVAALPYRDDAALDAAVDEGSLDLADTGLPPVAPAIGDALSVVLAWDGYDDVAVDEDAPAAAELRAAAEDLRAALDALGEVDEVEEVEEVDEDRDDSTSPVGAPVPVVVAAARYASVLTDVADSYRRAAALVELAGACAPSCGLPADADVSRVVNSVVAQAVGQRLDAEREYLLGAGDLAGDTSSAVARLEATLVDLRGTGAALSANVAGHLDAVSGLRASMADVLEDERTVASATDKSDRMTVDAAARARALAASSEILAASARSGADGARGVVELLERLRADVGDLHARSAEVDARSDDLEDALTGQVGEAQAFAEAFSGVLANAHRSGVLNERLLQFLVEPVDARPRDAVRSHDVARPFPWVLIAFCLSFAAAYLVSQRPGAGGGLGQGAVLATERTGAAWTTARATARATLAGLLVAGVSAWGSVASLGIAREAQPRWAAAVVLVCLAFTLLTHWVVSQWGRVGATACVLLLVAYVFVSDAAGPGATDRVSAVVAAVNPLSGAERALGALLGTAPDTSGVLGVLVLAVLGAALVSLLVRRDLLRRLRVRRRAEA